MSEQTPRGELVFFDEDTQHAIYWNGAATFNVWSALGNSFSFRPLREVNVFTVYDVDSSDSAMVEAEHWWSNYGQESTLGLEREGL